MADQNSNQDQYVNRDTSADTNSNADVGAGTDRATPQSADIGPDTGAEANTDTDTDLGADQYTNWNKGTYVYPRTGADPQPGSGAGPDDSIAPNPPVVSGGEGLYGDEDQDTSDENRDRHGNPYEYGGMGGPVPPGSSCDQYGTRGSQDQYGNQQ